MFTLIKLKMQIFGRFLSNMIMPNISVFIAWGILTIFFSPLGWYPNYALKNLTLPIIMYLLPILIGYTGGRLIAGEKGGIVGSVSIIGAIINTKMPMILGAMIVGPLAGWTIKYFDIVIGQKAKNGFEMLVNNFSIAIIGVVLSIFSFAVIGPLVEFFSYYLASTIKIIISYHLLPLISIIIEPAKIFFLNNAINHGIFSPLGIQETISHDSSMFFLIESNPGPGLGVLMAWYIFGTGDLSKSAGSAAIIEFLGGIHEIYFPYVLTEPKLIIALILGGMTGVFTLEFFHGGLISTVSPGSIIAITAMTPKGLYSANTLSIFCSFLVSFLISSILFKINFKNYLKKETIHTSQKCVDNTTSDCDFSFNNVCFKNIKNIIVACDAGMGSSVMSASILRKKIRQANLTNISISNMAINVLPPDAGLIITHQNLTSLAKIYSPKSQHISLKTFLNPIFYDSLVKELIKYNDNVYQDIPINHTSSKKSSNDLFRLSKKNIFLNQFADNKEEAIVFIGKNLVKQGYTTSHYIDAMLEREKIHSTWLGESIALPHGTIAAKDAILKTGIIFCQFPKGVHFGEEADDIAYIVIGIAAKNDEHITVVSNITNALDDKDIIKMLSTTKNVDEVLLCLSNTDIL